MKTWKIDYKGHSIVVHNKWFSGEQLIVDGELQDEQIGVGIRSRLYGKITNPDGSTERIKISLGGFFQINCRVFVDDRLIPAMR